ncbi:MAG TPA: DMT family transporter [Gaiellaceae bacterium]|jgi:drug/metabolite transporter (DMT)-like permease
MPATALAFVLAAAGFHALWNLLLARSRDVDAAAAVALLTAEIVFLPLAVVVWRADTGVWPWLVGSGLFELAYFALLAAAYRRAPLSVVYPVARGSAPVVVLAVSVLALGHGTSSSQVGGVALIVGGVLLVRGFSGADAAGLAFGVAIACCIAGYTLIDKNGIEHANPITYLELSMAVPTAAFAGAVARAKGVGAIRAAVGAPAIVAGIATFVAYAFVLAALERASAASVAAVRETSVVIAAGLAAVVLKEQVTRWRFLGACVVVAGIALLR